MGLNPTQRQQISKPIKLNVLHSVRSPTCKIVDQSSRPCLLVQGKVALVSAILSDFSPGNKSLWKQNPCPFVYIYDKISDLDICVDARYIHGNTCTCAHVQSTSTSLLVYLPSPPLPPLCPGTMATWRGSSVAHVHQMPNSVTSLSTATSTSECMQLTPSPSAKK